MENLAGWNKVRDIAFGHGFEFTRKEPAPMIIGRLSQYALGKRANLQVEPAASTVWGLISRGCILRKARKAWRLAAWAYAVGVTYD